jgi:hypothetical protein
MESGVPTAEHHHWDHLHTEVVWQVSFALAIFFFCFEATHPSYHSGLAYPNDAIHLHPLDAQSMSFH